MAIWTRYSQTMDTSNQYVKYRVKLTLNSQNVTNNTSNVTVEIQVWRTNTGYTTYGSGTCYVTIDGTQYTSSITPDHKFTYNSYTVVFSRTLDITHNADGNKTLNISAYIRHDRFSSSSQSWSTTLNTIPRTSSVSVSSSNVEFGKSVTINISRYSSSFTHTLRYSVAGQSGTIATDVGTSYTWTVPTSLIAGLSNAASATCTIYCDTYSGSTLVGTKSTTLTLAIPVSSVSLSAGSVNYGSSVTINISRAHSKLTHTIRYNWNNNTGTIVSQTTSTSYQWTVPNNFMNYIPNSTSTTGTIYIDTYNGTALVGTKSASLTTIVPDSVVPDFTNISHSEANSAVAALGLGSGVYAQNLSKINISIVGATGAYGSTITSYKITYDGINYNAQSATTNTITNSGTRTISATVTDSRGRTKTKTVNVTVLAYSSPTITSFTVKRCNSDGTDNNMGTYIKVTYGGSFSTLNSKNTATLYIETKPKTSGTWTTKESFSVGSSFSGTKVYSGYDITSSYDVRLRLVDKFYSVTSTKEVSTGVVTMSWGKQGVGIGKIWERGALDVGGDVYIAGTLTVPSLIAKINIPSSAPPSAWPVGFVAGIVYNNGYPVSYGTIFSYKGTTGNSCVQILQAWPGSDGGEAYLYIRSARDVGTDVFGPWRKVWSENNDGHGSGLDADLLDGLHASSFVNKAGDTMTGRLIVPAGTSGGIAFPNNAFGGSGDTASITLQNPSGGENQELIIQVTNDASDIVHIKTPSNNGVKINNNTVWHAGNDGAGSGLDADLLDGYHASSFLLTSGGTVSGQITLRAGTSSGKAVKSTDSYTNPAIASTSKYSKSGAWVTWDYPDFSAAPIVIHRDDNNLGTKVRNVTASSCEVCMADTATGYVRAIAIGGV